MSVFGGVALALVSAQLIATMIFQRARARRLHLLDLLSVVPGWTFFVQPSSEYDLAVEVRWQRDDGELSAWQETDLTPPRRPWHWLWQTDGWGNGVVRMAIDTIDRRRAAGGDPVAGSSLAYATILAFARAQPHDRPATALQFALVRIAAGHRTRWFESNVHPC